MVSTMVATAQLFSATLFTSVLLCVALLAAPLAAQTTSDGKGTESKETGGQIPTNRGTEPVGSIPTSLIKAQKDPAVKSILELDPRSVEQIIRSVDLLIRLDQGELAKRVLERFSQADADEKELAQLAKTFKPGVFIRISLAPDLAPLGQAVAEEVSQASKKVWFAPARIKELINNLRSDGAAQRNGGRGNVRNRALAELRDLGTEAVVAIIAAMAQDPSQGNQATLVRALVEMGPQAVDPLTGALQSPDDTVRSSSIDALGQLGVVRVIPLFIGWSVDSHQTLRCNKPHLWLVGDCWAGPLVSEVWWSCSNWKFHHFTPARRICRRISRIKLSYGLGTQGQTDPLRICSPNAMPRQ